MCVSMNSMCVYTLNREIFVCYIFVEFFLSLEHTDVRLIFVVLGHRQNIFNFSIYIELP